MGENSELELIDTQPTLSDFIDDMNKSPNTAYEMRGDHVIEVELFREHPNIEDSNNRGNIRIWTAQTHNGSYVPGDGAKSTYKWFTAASGWKNFDKYVPDSSDLMDHAEEIAKLLADSDTHFRDFKEDNEGGIVDPRTDI